MVMSDRDNISDAFSPIDYKLRNVLTPLELGIPGWVGDHARRLEAYDTYQKIFDNKGRTLLSPPDGQDAVAGRDPEDHREYGDAALLVKTILGGVLGSEQVIQVDGAELYVPDGENSDAVINAFERQSYLRDWATSVRLGLKMIEVEREAITLGDGVYVVGWDDVKRRVWLRKYNPGFYFPVLDDDDVDDGFPVKVHLAWELPPLETEPSTVRIRRITYELVDFKDDEPGVRYAYAPDVVSRTRCLLSDGVWTIDSLAATVDDLTEQRVKWMKTATGDVKRRLDLGIDFIPVVHLPNTVAEEEHFGRSSLAEVMQILDDLAAADTDLQAASATTGTPVIAVSGVTSGDSIASYGPGSVFETGDGSLNMLDTSKSLDALLKYVKDLLSRLATNARVSEAALGRVNAAQVPSGIALALSFSPMEQMVREMRQVRDERYPLLLRFVLRLALVGGAIPSGSLPRARVAFGSFLPTDRKTIVDEVVALLQAGAISTRTAVLMLMNAGLPIDDAAHEVARIQHMATKKALELSQATADPAAAREFLGLEPAETPIAQVITKLK